ncbi:hypothetical protein LshimejAT787_0800940 [Lyophyllum shimeji]|uniref:MYND-type domain-containing protein n=1 Tax=Lyophyllum shimeji TaxID=47721 RepID=A0A9P3UP13_LYOSH|nr:hypothetical protein LshimejAT787_0800940 [Lyophyllum shimeji]
MPQIEYRTEVIQASEQNVPTPNDMSELPTMSCNADDCPNYKSLRKCTRCRSAYYCSVDCQKKHWTHHMYKEACRMYVALLHGDVDNEPPLRRHLRHWTARFEHSLTCAAIVGMNINRSFSNIDKYVWRR